MRDTVRIVAAEQVDDEIVAALAQLLPQLAPQRPLPTRAQLEQVVHADCTTLLLARHPDSGAILGTLTLVVYRMPTGVRAYIEDVVVDGAARGLGAGEALVRAALERAAALGAEIVDLTSHASREAANRLYVKLGFVPRDTNAYRYVLAQRRDE
ncbi:MAG TPA: GNAT family N-acetyltransferase [Longimicrobiales bacterium]|nr:GNAT family N-acetyltransferase [Longimicrobiales bacterium]